MRTAILVATSLLLGVHSALAVSPTAEQVEFFERRIRPVLEDTCASCHREGYTKGDLQLDSRAGLLAGGKRGKVIVPGKPEDSLLIQAIRRTDAKLQMPPRKPLSAQQVRDFTRWIREGAYWPGEAEVARPRKDPRDHWAYKPLARVVPPQVKDPAWQGSAIDRFVKARLESRGLEPVGLADRATLLRRVTFDLTGLPPTPEELQAFLADDSPQAFDTVIDRLLASPHYGERWGRHWLDVVRYADTAGDNSDFPIPQAYLYRNYVIDAFNADMPYDQFVQEQIAGDLMPAQNFAERKRQRIATGYIAQARRFGSLYLDYPQHLTIEDTIDNLGKTFLGLTISCARCHDHKFDAISHRDYHALYGIFASTRYSFPGVELSQMPRHLLPLIPAQEVDRLETSFREKVKPLRAEVNRKLKIYRAMQAKVKAAPADQQEFLKPQEWALNVDTRKSIRKIEQLMLKEIPPYPRAYGAMEGEIHDACIHIKGNPEELGEVVPRGFLSVLGGQKLSKEEAKKTSGRLQLARWLTDPSNPLTPRVMVNRIWQYHFGRGIVATANGFGVQGLPPSHPELLDYLAQRFIDSGWSIKQLHREILRSRAYQLSSKGGTPQHHQTDPDNLFLWRHNRQRLDAESLRDTLLVLSGKLDPSKMTEPYPFPPVAKWHFTQHRPFKEEYPSARRSVYLMTKRMKRLAFFATFDGADRNASTSMRTQSITTSQALYLLNNDLVHQCADSFARRLIEAQPGDGERIDLAYRLAFTRPPAEEEREQALAYLDRARALLSAACADASERNRQAWTSLARVLLRTNEFLYVD